MTVTDFVPIIGTGVRATAATGSHAMGDHQYARSQWGEAAMNAAGDAVGMVTGGTGKVAMAGAKTAVKVGVKVTAKKAVNEVAKQGVKQATKQATKNVAKKVAAEVKKDFEKTFSKKLLQEIAKKTASKGATKAVTSTSLAGACKLFVDKEMSVILSWSDKEKKQIIRNGLKKACPDIGEIPDNELLSYASAYASATEDLRKQQHKVPRPKSCGKLQKKKGLKKGAC